MSKDYLLAPKALKTLESLSFSYDPIEAENLIARLPHKDNQGQIKMLIDESPHSRELAKAIQNHQHQKGLTPLPIITAPSPPVASYLKTVKKIDLSSTDYLVVIAHPPTWGLVVRRLFEEPGWDTQKLILSSNLLNPVVKGAIGTIYYKNDNKLAPHKKNNPSIKQYRLMDESGQFYDSFTPGLLGGNRRLKIYGRLDCKSANNAIAKGGYVKHRVFFKDEQTAIRAGYRPCAKCLPKEYTQWKKDQNKK